MDSVILHAKVVFLLIYTYLTFQSDSVYSAVDGCRLFSLNIARRRFLSITSVFKIGIAHATPVFVISTVILGTMVVYIYMQHDD